MATKNIKKILLNKDGDNYVADIEDIENRITQNSSNLETAKQELSNKCDEALSEAKAYTDTEKAKYLPLTGGTVTDDVAINGALTVPNGLIRTNDTSKSINIRCTTDDKSGAKIVLNGKDAANNAGEFIITATDGTNSFDFCASPTGKLTYGDKNIVRSVNNINADDKGNVSVVGILGSVTGEIKWFAFNKAPDGYLVCNGATVSRITYADLFAVIGTLYGKGDGINATSKFGTAVFDGEDGNLIRVTVATNESDASSFDVTTYFKGSLVETQTVKKATELVNNSYITWNTSVALVAGDDVTFTGGTGSTFNLPNLIDKFAQGSTTVGTAIEAGLPDIEGSFPTYDRASGVYLGGAFYGLGRWNGAVHSGENDNWGLGVGFKASRSSSIYGNSKTVQPPALTLLPCIKY